MNLDKLPVTQRAVIPESYLDVMGHMNVMWWKIHHSSITLTLCPRMRASLANINAPSGGVGSPALIRLS